MSTEEKIECTVCLSPTARPMIASLLECGASPGEMAAHTSLTVGEIETHLEHVAAAIPESIGEQDAPGDPLKISDDRLALLLQRAQETYLAAGLQADTKTQVSALGTQLRLELEFRRREELKAARHDTQPLTHDPNTWSHDDRTRVLNYLDWVVADHDARQTREKVGIA